MLAVAACSSRPGLRGSRAPVQRAMRPGLASSRVIRPAAWLILFVPRLHLRAGPTRGCSARACFSTPNVSTTVTTPPPPTPPPPSSSTTGSTVGGPSGSTKEQGSQRYSTCAHTKQTNSHLLVRQRRDYLYASPLQNPATSGRRVFPLLPALGGGKRAFGSSAKEALRCCLAPHRPAPASTQSTN